MSLSSVVVYYASNQEYAVRRAIEAQPNIEIFHHCPWTGRLVLVLDHDDEEAAATRLEWIKALPHVLAADMVYHYREPVPPPIATGSESTNSHLSAEGVRV